MSAVCWFYIFVNYRDYVQYRLEMLSVAASFDEAISKTT